MAGRVDLAAFEGAGSLLAPALASFQARYPRIEVRLFTSAQVVSLTRRESDVAVRATDQPSERLFGRRVGHLHFAVYANTAIAQDPERAAAAPWVRWDPRMSAADVWNLTHADHAHRGVAVEVDSILVLRDLVLAGAGVAYLPVSFARQHPGLVGIGPMPQPDVGVSVWVLTPTDLRRSARVRALMEHLCDHLPTLLDV